MIRKSGTVYLYAQKDDAMLAYYRYKCVKDRKRCIQIWERRYAKKYHLCYVQVNPDLPDLMEIKKNGENYKRRRDNRCIRNTLTDSDFKKISIYDD